MVKQNLKFCLFIVTSWLVKIKSSAMFSMSGKQTSVEGSMCHCVG